MEYLDGRRSNFPESGKTDKILELFNLPVSQRKNALEYKELKLKENLTTEDEDRLNTLATQLQRYIIDVEKWNFFGDVIVNMQDHYLNETVGYINGLQNKANDYLTDTKSFMTAVKNEASEHADNKQIEIQDEVDKITYRGEWQPGAQYYSKNIVSSSGEGYIAQRDSKGQAPPNTLYWGKITTKGDKGDPSLNINYKGEFNVGTPYVVGDAVTFGGFWYYAKKNTSGNAPVNAEFWELQSNQTAVGMEEPFDNRVNLWIDTSI